MHHIHEGSTLRVGGNPVSGSPYLALSEALEPSVPGDHAVETYSAVILQTPLENLEDDWRTLRALRDRLRDDGVLAIGYGSAGTGRLATEAVQNLVRLSGFEPGLVRHAGDGMEMEARRRPCHMDALSCSVIVPCRNEADNVALVVERMPTMGTHTEIIFVDDGSTDGTSQRITDLIHAYPNRSVRALTGRVATGKAGAVSDGFDVARGDVMIIMDADMAVAPEDLPRFYMALAENVTDVANGTRFVYQMDEGAMSPRNRVGNQMFSLLLSVLLDTRMTDTLCGTKAIFKRDWPRIKALRPLFGGHDRWGDFDLLLGAHHLGLRIIDVPVRYRARMYGESKMRIMRDGTAFALTCLSSIRRARRITRGTHSVL